jgi:hypothetical protein
MKKHGDTRDDGYRFWSYHPKCKGGEWWVSPEKWIELKEKDLTRRRLHTPPRAPKRNTFPTPKYGDLREDGFRFVGFDKKKGVEIWNSPEVWARNNPVWGLPKPPKDPHLKYIRNTLRNIKRRAEEFGWAFDLDKDYLAGIFPQDGRCPLSGELMVWGMKDGIGNSPSVDRIDLAKGYIKGNVWWISHMENVKKAKYEKVLPPIVNAYADGEAVTTDWSIIRPD